MPRIVTSDERFSAIKLMVENHLGQREIEKQTGLSRPYIRKLARELGYQFPRNGIEVVGPICMCTNCGSFFRRPKSKIDRAKNTFCDDVCRKAYQVGPNHPAWKTGESSKSFSAWVKNQSEYSNWRKLVLERDGYKCVISGREDNLDVHHILPKSIEQFSSLAFDVNNGLTLNEEVHNRIHELIRNKMDYFEAIEKVREEFSHERERASSSEVESSQTQ